MPARPDTAHTTALAIEILRLIPRHAKITASQLHQQLQDKGFDRDLRTIQRQLDMLSQHFDIERDDTNRPYGWRWKPHSNGLNLSYLTPQESLLLHLAEEHLRHLLPAPLMRSMDSFFVQAQRTLSHAQHALREREWPHKIRVVPTSQPLLPPAIDPDVLSAVSEALYSNHWLQLNYHNASGKRSSIEVMPLGLAQQGPRLYLVCRYKNFANERSLAVHRIQAATVTPFAFERPSDFDFQRYDDDGRFGFGEGARVRLSFHITPEAGYHLRETPLSHDQTITELANGHLLISATVVDSAMLDWWLRGFGEAVCNTQKMALAPAPQ